MIKTVAFIDSVHPILEEQLTNIGVECINAQHLSQNQIEEKIHFWDGIVIRSRIKINDVLLSKATKLKFIADIFGFWMCILIRFLKTFLQYKEK